MPYADREKQLAYMREYMKRKRLQNRIAKLNQRKEHLLEQFETDPHMKYFVKKEEIGIYIDKEVARLKGLLKSGVNSPENGGTP